MGKLGVGNPNIQVPHMSSLGVPELYASSTLQGSVSKKEREKVENRYKQMSETMRESGAMERCRMRKNEVPVSNTGISLCLKQ